MTRRTHVPVVPGLLLPIRIEGSGTYEDGSFTLHFEGRFNESQGVYELDTIKVTRAGDAPLNGTTLRSVRVQDALGDVMRAADIRLADGSPYVWPYEEGGFGFVQTREVAKDARAEEAKRLYAIAHAFGLPELREIQRALVVSQSTAGRLLKEGR